jgi:hypothetical protein
VGFTARRRRFDSFQYDRTVQKLDAIIHRWDSEQLPEDATFLPTLSRSFHAVCDVESNRNTRRYVFHERYCMLAYDTGSSTGSGSRIHASRRVFCTVVDRRHDDSFSDKGRQKDVDLSRLRSSKESPPATSSNVAASSNVIATHLIHVAS